MGQIQSGTIEDMKIEACSNTTRRPYSDFERLLYFPDFPDFPELIDTSIFWQSQLETYLFELNVSLGLAGTQNMYIYVHTDCMQ